MPQRNNKFLSEFTRRKGKYNDKSIMKKYIYNNALLSHTAGEQASSFVFVCGNHRESWTRDATVKCCYMEELSERSTGVV